jgi:hypothetical protein
MASVWQVVYNWSGTTGGAGFTNLFFEALQGNGTEALAAVTKGRILFQALNFYLPNTITITPSSDVRLIEDSTGALTNIFTVTGVSGVVGSAPAGVYSGPSGGCIDWLTGVIHGRHLMVGRTFLVPMANNAYQNNGTLGSQVVADMATAAESFRTASGPAFGVWGRPRKAVTLPGGEVRPALVGHFARAISSRVPDKAVVLRSRRD